MSVLRGPDRNYLHGAEKVKSALRFKRIFAKSAELRVQDKPLANGFPPIPGICKMFFEVIDFAHPGRLSTFQENVENR